MDAFLLEALTYLAAAVISVPIAKRLGLGSVLGYLVAGLIIGPSVLGLVQRTEGVREVAEFGIVMMLFLVGLELQPARLWSMRKAVFGLGSVQVLVTAAFGAAAALALGVAPAPAIAIGLVVAMSSTAIVLQALTEKGQLHTNAGELSFAILLLQDLAVIPILALLPLLSPSMGGQTATGVLAAFPDWVQALAVPAAVATVVLAGRWLIRPWFRLIARTRLREIFTASALLLVAAAALLTKAAGLSPALGAFLGGVVLAESEFRHELEGDIEPFKGLLLGLFFISVGAHIDLPLLIAHPWLLLGLVAGTVALKAVLLLAVLRVSSVPKRDAIMTALALSQVGEFAFVIVDFAAGNAVFTPEIAGFLNLLVALSMLTTPLLFIGFNAVLSRRGVAASTRVPDVIEARNRVIIAGFGRVGQVVGRLLIGRGLDVTVLEHDEEQLETLLRFGFKPYYGDARREAILRAAGASEASILVVATDVKETTIEIVETAKRNFPNLTVLARPFDRGHAYVLDSAGADGVVRETFGASVELGCKALKTLGFPAYEAERMGNLFRRHDYKGYEALRAFRDGDVESYALASRAHYAELAKVLARDAQERGPLGEDAWDVDSLIEEIREGEITPDPQAGAMTPSPRARPGS